ncbi:MAG TPA: lipopolysaccharide biosynthesis protein [Baekduia sp.]|nr:lipopolysaccharide biosynthesis protein [Baekduia sp.]
MAVDVSGDAPARDTLRGRVLSGVAWKAASRGLFEVTKLMVAVALARLLTPSDYGLAGMVIILAAFQPVLSGVALASALVQRPVLSEDDRSTVFWTNLATGACFSMLGVALSRPAASFYGNDAVQPLFAAMSLCYVVSALGITHGQLLVREMDFRSLELRTMAGTVVGAVAAIATAAAGGGAWALVVQSLATLATSTVLLWALSDWHPRLRFSRQSLREVRGFGGNVSGTLLLFQLNENADNVLIGRYLGAHALGAYALGYNIILLPFSRLMAPLHDVLYPAFTRLQDDRERMAATWLRILRLLVAATLPAMLGLVVVSQEFVRVAFGAKWHEAVPVVQVLAWVGVLLAVQGLNSMIFMAVGRTQTLLRCAFVSFLGGLASFVVGLQWGIVGVAACFAVWSTGMQLAYVVLASRALSSPLSACWHAIAGVVQATAVAVAAMLLVRQGLLHLGAGALIRLLVTALAGAVVYLPAAAWRAPSLLDELRAIRRRRAPVPAAGAAIA